MAWSRERREDVTKTVAMATVVGLASRQTNIGAPELVAKAFAIADHFVAEAERRELAARAADDAEAEAARG